MGFIDRLFGKKTVVNEAAQVGIHGEMSEFKEMVVNGQLWELMDLLRLVQRDRKPRLKSYEKMALDSTVNSAMEMMAEDATQFDQGKNHIFWVVSENKDLEAELDTYLQETIDIESRVFNWAYKVVQNGEILIRTYATRKREIHEIASRVGYKPLSEGFNIREPAYVKLPSVDKDDLEYLDDEYLEEVDDPSKILDLTRFGKTVGYFVQNDTGEGGELFPPDEFIHIMSDRGHHRSEFSIEVNERGNPDKEKKIFKVKYGTSFIDGAVQIFNVVHMLEDVMVMSRMARSALFRLFKVNVGSANRQETVKILKDLKNAIKSRERINTDTDYYKSDSNPIPFNDNIYIPTRGGKGDVEVAQIGGEVDVRAMADVEFFFNKLAGSLRVPKAFIGFEESLPGGIGNTSLTRLDIRYARTVKRLVTCLKNGIRDILNYHLVCTDRENLQNTFEICGSRINDAEESDRVNDFGVKAEAASSVVNLMGNLAGVPETEMDKEAFKNWMFTEFLGVEFSKFAPKCKNPPSEEEGMGGFSGGGGGGFSGLSHGGSSFSDIGGSSSGSSGSLDTGSDGVGKKPAVPAKPGEGHAPTGGAGESSLS